MMLFWRRMASGVMTRHPNLARARLSPWSIVCVRGRKVELGRLISPNGPPQSRFAAEQVEARTRAEPLDALIKFVRFPAVFAPRGDDDLAHVPGQPLRPAAPAEQAKFDVLTGRLAQAEEEFGFD